MMLRKRLFLLKHPIEGHKHVKLSRFFRKWNDRDVLKKIYDNYFYNIVTDDEFIDNLHEELEN